MLHCRRSDRREGSLPRSSPRSRRCTALADPNNASRLQHRCWAWSRLTPVPAAEFVRREFKALGCYSSASGGSGRQCAWRSGETSDKGSEGVAPDRCLVAVVDEAAELDGCQSFANGVELTGAASMVRPPRSPASARRSIRAFRPAIAAAAAGCAWPVSSGGATVCWTASARACRVARQLCIFSAAVMACP
jgi:hypothetical protein